MPRRRVPRDAGSRRGYGTPDGQGVGQSVRYGLADPEVLREAIDAVTSAGDAILFSRTSDSGALVVRVLSDAGNGCWYPPTVEALAVVLSECVAVARGL